MLVKRLPSESQTTPHTNTYSLLLQITDGKQIVTAKSILGDFNVVREASEKKGQKEIDQDVVGDFSLGSMIQKRARSVQFKVPSGHA